MEVDNIKDRILEFLKAENKSSAHFAKEIGVQPSAISHIISGRNKPSLDFVMKMITRYPYISSEWLIFGKGPMYLEKSESDLFSAAKDDSSNADDDKPEVRNDDSLIIESISSEKSALKTDHSDDSLKDRKKAARIVVFYKDNTFSEHFPGGE